MSNLMKLGLAIGLAVLAGVLNFVYLQNKTKGTLYLKAKQSIKEGTPLETGMFSPLLIQDAETQLAKTLVPVSELQVLLGVRATRDYEPGDVVFQRDLPSALPRWDVLGPFRLLSVGSQLLTPSSKPDRGSNNDANTITVAIEEAGFAENGPAGEAGRRLLQIIDGIRNGGRQRDSRLRLVAIQIYRNEQGGNGQAGEGTGGEETGSAEATGTNDTAASEAESSDAATETAVGSEDKLGLRVGEVAVIVPLEDVRSIPSVLVIGRQIGFVVPAYKP